MLGARVYYEEIPCSDCSFTDRMYCRALVAGNAVKAGVRFLSYDSIKLMVADRTVSLILNLGREKDSD